MGLRVCAVDIDDGKLTLATKMGADFVVNALHGEPEEAVRINDGGQGEQRARLGGVLSIELVAGNDANGVNERLSVGDVSSDDGFEKLGHAWSLSIWRNITVCGRFRTAFFSRTTISSTFGRFVRLNRFLQRSDLGFSG